MTERLNETKVIAPNQVAPREKRAEWERPQLRKLDMGKAEAHGGGTFDGTIGFS